MTKIGEAGRVAVGAVEAEIDAANGRNAPTARRRVFRSAALGLAALALTTTTGCSAFFPQTGPTTSDIVSEDDEQTIEFAIVSLDVAAVTANRLPPVAPFDLDFRGVGVESTGDVGVGDVLEVSVWENVEGGLFTSVGAKASVIPGVLVAEDGFVSLPYIGRIRAAGRKMVDIQETIRKELEDQTLQPQVIVTRSQAVARAVSVQGSVRNPSIYPLVLHQDRLIPILAAAGGAVGDPSLTEITVRRGDAASSAWLDDIYDDASANIALRSGDAILAKEHDHFFNAFGAVRRSGRLSFSSRETTLLDAISQLGGLDGASANPTGVFVFRRENVGLLPSLSRIDEADPEKALAQLEGGYPVVYQLELNRSEAMFLASQFPMRSGDTIYVTEAPYSAFRKVLSIVVPALATAGSINNLSEIVTE